MKKILIGLILFGLLLAVAASIYIQSQTNNEVINTKSQYPWVIDAESQIRAKYNLGMNDLQITVFNDKRTNTKKVSVFFHINYDDPAIPQYGDITAYFQDKVMKKIVNPVAFIICNLTPNKTLFYVEITALPQLNLNEMLTRNKHPDIFETFECNQF